MKPKPYKLRFSETRPFVVAMLLKRHREWEKEQNQKRADAAREGECRNKR